MTIRFDSTPTVFRGRILRSGVKYNNLKCHLFTLDERIWFCSAVRGTLTQPSSTEIDFRKKTSRRRIMNMDNVKKWLKAYEEGILKEYSEALWLNHCGWPGPPSV